MAEDPLTTVPDDPGIDPLQCLAENAHARLVSIADWLGVQARHIEDHPIDPFEGERDLPSIAVFVGNADEPFGGHQPPHSPNATGDVLIEVFVKGRADWATVLRPLMWRIKQGLLRYHRLIPSGLVPKGLREQHDMAEAGKNRAVRGLITLTFAYQALYEPILPDTLERVVVDMGQPDGTTNTIANLTPGDCAP